MNKGRVEFMFRLRERNKVRVDYFERQPHRQQGAGQGHGLRQSDLRRRPAGDAELSTGDSSPSPTPTRSSATSASRSARGSRCYFLQLEAIMQQTRRSRSACARRSPPRRRSRRCRWISPGASPAAGPLTGHGAYLKAIVNELRRLVRGRTPRHPVPLEPELRRSGSATLTSRLADARSGGSFPGAARPSIKGLEAFVRFSF